MTTVAKLLLALAFVLLLASLGDRPSPGGDDTGTVPCYPVGYDC